MCMNNSQAFRNSSPSNSGAGNLMTAWITAAHDRRVAKGGVSPVGGSVVAPGNAARYMAAGPAFSQSAGPRLDNRLGA